MKKVTYPEGVGAVSTISEAKIKEKLYPLFCNVFKNQDQTYYLFHKIYFDAWVLKNVTLPPNHIACDSYTFITLPVQNSLQQGKPMLVPLHILGLIQDTLEATYTKNPKTGLVSFSFIYKLSRQTYEGFTSLYEAETAFANFKKLEFIKYYLTLQTDYERDLLNPYISSDFKGTGKFDKANHTRIGGKTTWQYQAWTNLLSSLRGNNYLPLESCLNLTQDQKLMHSALLNFDYFEGLVTYIRGLTTLEDVILTYDFFGDCIITRDSLFYLPKRLVQNHKEWVKASSFKPTKTATGFAFRARNTEGKLTRSQVFKTEPEAVTAYTQFKFETLKNLYGQYQPNLPTNFCQRFEKEILSHAH